MVEEALTPEAKAARKARVRAILIIGAVLIIVIGVIVAMVLTPRDAFAEWKRSNPPEWAYIGKTDSASMYINTRLVVPMPLDRVAVVTRNVPRDDTDEGKDRRVSEALTKITVDHAPADVTPYALFTVKAFGCTPEDFGQVILSGFIGNVSNQPLEEPRGEAKPSDIPPGSGAAAEREAACWLLGHHASAGVRIPNEYRDSRLGMLQQFDPFMSANQTQGPGSTEKK